MLKQSHRVILCSILPIKPSPEYIIMYMQLFSPLDELKIELICKVSLHFLGRCSRLFLGTLRGNFSCFEFGLSKWPKANVQRKTFMRLKMAKPANSCLFLSLSVYTLWLWSLLHDGCHIFYLHGFVVVIQMIVWRIMVRSFKQALYFWVFLHIRTNMVLLDLSLHSGMLDICWLE